MNNTSETKRNVPQKGLITDLKEDLLSPEVWSYARNATLVSNTGQMQFVQFEQSTLKCVDLPATLIGFTKILGNRWALFLTDNKTSEIGIFDESKCTYETLIKDNCLNFSTSYPIQATFREMKYCTETIYWTDGNNPRRYMNLQKIPYKFTRKNDECQTKVFTTDLDCERLLVDKNISIPSIDAKQGTSGSLRNGSYSFACAYSIDGQRITDYFGMTLPINLWTHENFGQSIELKITNLDQDYDQYELAVIYVVEGVTYYKKIGNYPITTSSVTFADANRDEFETITLSDILVPRAKYSHADNVQSNDMYLMWSGVKTLPDLNYQLQAMKIKSKYIVKKLPSVYYVEGGQERSFLRDERYAFGIRWVYKNGQYSSIFHIPGPAPRPEDIAIASGADVYEDPKDGIVRNYDVIETAGRPTQIDSVYSQGRMGTWLSTELYPDRKDLYGDDACTPVRFHKMPNDATSPRYEQGGEFINLLGVQFEGIEYPKDDKGNILDFIQGYEIVVANRDGEESIIAKGVLTNVRKYKEVNNREVLYANYPYNDLRADTLISSKQTYRKLGGERDFQPLTEYSKKEFNFYSPETQFSRIRLGDELRIYTHENSAIRGFFEHVYQHPKQKMVTDGALYFALVVGAIDGYLSTRGKKCYVKKRKIVGIDAEVASPWEVTVNPVTGPTVKTIENTYEEQVCDSIVNGLADPKLTSTNLVLKFLLKALKTLIDASLFVYFSLQTARDVLRIIQEAAEWQSYELQYNSHGFFNSYKQAPKDFTRRKIEYYQYLSDGLNTVEGKTFNNYKRENSVYLRLNSDLENPSFEDRSRNSLFELGICDNIFQEVLTSASVFYGAVKRRVPNQYGRLESIRYISTGGEVFTKNKTDYIFGGDSFITRMTIRRTHHFFSQFLKNVPDGYIYDYRPFRNVGYPRFWLDSTPYDMSELVRARPRRSNLPRNKHNLDCLGTSGSLTVVKRRYFYTQYSGVLDFFTESKYNLDYRDWKDEYPNFYSRFNNNLSEIFRSDRVEVREDFVYDRSFFKKATEMTSLAQRENFSERETKCGVYERNTVIYSLPANKSQNGDSWLIYLPFNRHSFSNADFGTLTTMKGIDNQRIMFLFDKSAPYITPGRDEMQLDGSGRTITLGDGNLFARTPIPIAYTDVQYGSSQSRWAFVNTQYGSFYPSQEQGRLFNFTGKMDEIGINGMSFWLKNHCPSHLLEDFPEYPYKDNPLRGTGMQIAFDNFQELIYFTKKDYSLKEEYKGLVKFDAEKDSFVIGAKRINLTDETYFEDASWTLSYDPKQRVFVSWHDWHPDWVMQSDSKFFTVKNNSIWIHNRNCKSFCNYYGIQHPYEFEPVVSNGPNVMILRSVEYQADTGFYHHDCEDFHVVLDETFDYARIHNVEQDSGLLKLVLQSKSDMRQLTQYPLIDSVNGHTKILYEKRENKYRFNQFDDIVKDRGEFSKRAFPLYHTDRNGYTRTFNPQATDMTKPVQLRKKFRQTWHKVLLVKEKPLDKNIILKFIDSKQLISFH